MKGIVFNIFEEFVTENWGEDTYEEILDATSLKTDEPFVAPGAYPDEDLMSLVATAVDQLGVPLPDALRAFGRFCFPGLARAYPIFLDGHTDAKTFLLTVETVIHVEVRKLMPDASPPRFDYEDPGPDQLVIQYKSTRKLCHLMAGLLDGVGDHFGIEIESQQTECVLDGAPHCRFELVFRAGSA